MKKLETLNLTVNAINKIPIEMSKLQNLIQLNLTDNPSLSDIDNVITLSNLEELILFGCNVKKLPHNFDKMSKLKYIGLTGNTIDASEINNLRVLLSNCKIVFNE